MSFSPPLNSAVCSLDKPQLGQAYLVIDNVNHKLFEQRGWELKCLVVLGGGEPPPVLLVPTPLWMLRAFAYFLLYCNILQCYNLFLFLMLPATTGILLPTLSTPTSCRYFVLLNKNQPYPQGTTLNRGVKFWAHTTLQGVVGGAGGGVGYFHPLKFIPIQNL